MSAPCSTAASPPRPIRIDLAADVPAPRTPYFCSGCPHNISTRADDDQLVGLGIGCHIMAALDDEGRGHKVGMTQMGGEGAQWIGMAPFTDDTHYAQNIGDGTFFHSGSLAVRAAVAAGVTMTYKILYNDAVAMTGGQTPIGRVGVPELTHWLAMEGVTKVIITTPDPGELAHADIHPIATVVHRDETTEAQHELARTPGVTALIHHDPCAAEERRLRNRGQRPALTESVWINSRVCEGCGDCAEQATCMSLVHVDTEFGTKMSVHQGSCNLDMTCVKGECPSFVIARHRPAAARRRRRIPRHRDPCPTPNTGRGRAARSSACPGSEGQASSPRRGSCRWRRTSRVCTPPESTRRGWRKRAARSPLTYGSRRHRSSATPTPAPEEPTCSSASTFSGRPATMRSRWRRPSAPWRW